MLTTALQRISRNFSTDRLPLWRVAIGFVLLALLATLSGKPALAQEGGAAADTTLEALVERARTEGATVIVLPGSAVPQDVAPQAGIADAAASLENRATRARAELAEVMAAAPLFFERVGEALRRSHPSGSAAWPLAAGALGVLFLLAGYGIERLFLVAARRFLKTIPVSRPRVYFPISEGAVRLVGVAVQALVAILLAIAFDWGQGPQRNLYALLFAAAAFACALMVFFDVLLMHRAPQYRLVNLDDDGARRLDRRMEILIVIAVASGTFCLWMAGLGLDRAALVLALIVTLSVSAALAGIFAITSRAAIAGMIMGSGDPREASLPTRMLAGSWHVIAVVYFGIAWSASIGRLLLDEPNSLGLLLAPVLVMFAAIAAYGVLLLLIEQSFASRAVPDGAERAIGAEAMPAVRPGMQVVAEHAARLLVILVTVWILARLWGLDIAAPARLLDRVFEIGIVVFLAYVAYEAVRVTIDRRIAAEQSLTMPVAHGGEGGSVAVEASRLGTLLPLFRTFLIVLIVAITVMIILSELGVDIGPLFAGAGIVGVAIGFGAQSLIRDVFSGAFFLLGDAFRKGEYVEIGKTRGTVERISIRSMQLRHHMGALHTIPFGEITQLTNYSRDWMIMKLPLRLTYDTDVNKVNKLVKKLGQELLADPEIGSNFLEPLKSQGVYQMEDSAMIVRLKFMTRPGDQFMVRKKVYARIRELFAENGIRFASREVTVRIADADGPLSDAEKQAVVGAVRPLLDEPGPEIETAAAR